MARFLFASPYNSTSISSKAKLNHTFYILLLKNKKQSQLNNDLQGGR